jgi:hypothetical protein
MKNTLLFNILENNWDWYKIERVDFSNPQNLKNWYPFGRIIKDKDIDPSIGKNKLLAFMRNKGILTEKNIPQSGTRWSQYFTRKRLKDFNNPKAIYYSYMATMISGEGIVEIQKMIALTRAAGGTF